MELDLSTFLLEVFNFLVLVWILHRFLYRPVLAAIERRKAAVAKTLADAGSKEEQARALEAKYQRRLSDWAAEKEQLLAKLQDEIAGQRAQLTAALQTEIDRQRGKEQILAARRMDDARRQAESEGTAQAVRFASRLLERVATQDVEDKLVQMVIEDLPRLSAERLDALRSAGRDGGHKHTVASAYPLPPARQSEVAAVLEEIAKCNLAVGFVQDPELIAGLRIDIGPWVLQANVREELAFFRERVNDGRQ